MPGHHGYHIFVLLDRGWLPADLKKAIKYWNLSIPEIRSSITLTRTNCALRWPLDVSVCDNSKLIYIAPPLLGPGVMLSLKEERLKLVKGSQRFAHLDNPEQDDEMLKALENQRLNQLRQQKGLPPKKMSTRSVYGETVAKNPEAGNITDSKEERGFTYLNINGGDSWGYYHPIDKPDILFNFKDEPNYLTRELLPDYYPEAKKRAEAVKLQLNAERKQAYQEEQQRIAEEAKQTGGKIYVAFRDKETDQYYLGTVDFEHHRHLLHTVASKDRITDFLAQHGQPKPELIQTWNFRFEPANDCFYDPLHRFVNRYQPSPFMRAAKKADGLDIPPHIRRVIHHVLGSDESITERFLNWLAVIFQNRQRSQTAWILQGTTGTGKGLLFNHIISPLFGEEVCRSITLPNLEDGFNKFMESCLVLFVDEVDTDQVQQMPKLVARLKNLITESRIPLRAMRTDLREVPNHLNIIMASNQPNSMRIEANDRRFNVCPRQEEKLLRLDEQGIVLIKAIRQELQAFADYLHSHPADVALARTALDNPAKRELQSITQTAMESVADALRNGDLAFFMDHLPDQSGGESVSFDGSLIQLPTIYREVIRDAIAAATAGGGQLLQHIHLFGLFELLVGGIPRTKARLTKRLGHHHLQVNPQPSGKTTLRGITVRWQATPEQQRSWRKRLAGNTHKTHRQ